VAIVIESETGREGGQPGGAAEIGDEVRDVKSGGLGVVAVGESGGTVDEADIERGAALDLKRVFGVDGFGKVLDGQIRDCDLIAIDEITG